MTSVISCKICAASLCLVPNNLCRRLAAFNSAHAYKSAFVKTQEQEQPLESCQRGVWTPLWRVKLKFTKHLHLYIWHLTLYPKQLTTEEQKRKSEELK